jgi:hypothetical protein
VAQGEGPEFKPQYHTHTHTHTKVPSKKNRKVDNAGVKVMGSRGHKEGLSFSTAENLCVCVGGGSWGLNLGPCK